MMRSKQPLTLHYTTLHHTTPHQRKLTYSTLHCTRCTASHRRKANARRGGLRRRSARGPTSARCYSPLEACTPLRSRSLPHAPLTVHLNMGV